MFEDLKASIEKTSGKYVLKINQIYYRRFDVGTFQQLLYVVPDFYSYDWVKKMGSYQQFTLLIDFKGEANVTQKFLDERVSTVKTRLLNEANQHY